MKNLPLLVATIVGTLFTVMIVSVIFSNNAQQAQQPVDPIVLLADATNIKGATESPKVTVVEFADFQCPACAAAAPLTQQLVEQYPDDVQVVFRHFPLTNIHPLAQTAAYATEAAADQGKFWEYRDLLFDTQQEWSDQSPEEFKETLGSYADQLEIDKSEFLERIESPEIRSRVSMDVSIGEDVGIAGTPTFFVNGRRTPAPELLSAVESMLNE